MVGKSTSLFVLVVLFLMLVPGVFAEFSVYRNVDEKKAKLSYEGESDTIDNIVVKNKNLVCDLKCNFHTNQDTVDRDVPGDWIADGEESAEFSVPVDIEGEDGAGTLVLTVSCWGRGLCGTTPNTKTKEIDFTYGYCGNAEDDSPYEKCDDCAADVKCDEGGTCDSDDPRADDRGCFTAECGDGYVDSGETPETCCVDTGCKEGKITKWLTDRECSADFTKVLRKGKVVEERCNTGTNACDEILLDSLTREDMDCTLSNTFCQDGSCGCSADYGACTSLGRCVPLRDKSLGDPCNCNFQCKDGLCDDATNLCVRGLVFRVSSEKVSVDVNEEITVSYSVSNPLDVAVEVERVSINFGSGVEVVSAGDCDSIVGGECRVDKVSLEAGGRLEGSFVVKVTSGGDKVLEGYLSYTFKEELIEIEDLISIAVAKCGNNIVDEGENQKTCCLDVPCGEGSSTYSFECNIDTKSCERKINLKVILAIVGAMLGIVKISMMVYQSHSKKKEIASILTEEIKRFGVDIAGGGSIDKYVKWGLDKGYARKKITSSLTDIGWSKSEVDTAFDRFEHGGKEGKAEHHKESEHKPEESKEE